MLDLTIEYECAFQKSAPETVPEIRISEVEGHNISNRVKNNFYTYQRAFLKDRTPSAAYALGVFYRHRRPCGQWLTRALEYFTSAAQNDYWQAAWMLQEIYRQGELDLMEPDDTACFTWLLKCYEGMPAPDISNQIARQYLTGRGTEKNIQKAKEYYAKGMVQGDRFAQTELNALLAVLREEGQSAEAEKARLACMKELFKSCGVKFKT